MCIVDQGEIHDAHHAGKYKNLCVHMHDYNKCNQTHVSDYSTLHESDEHSSTDEKDNNHGFPNFIATCSNHAPSDFHVRKKEKREKNASPKIANKLLFASSSGTHTTAD